jgi:AAA domain-containing protein
MKTIDIRRNAAGQTMTALSYGASRTGKTRFAATWPRPLFLSDNSEKGWETIRYMSNEDFYEPNRPPVIWALEEAADMFQAVDQLRRELAKDRNAFRTIVVDSLTFYLDSYFRYLESAAIAKAQGKRPEGRLLYADLNTHFANLAIEVSKLPVNVLWICLERGPSEDNASGAPMIPGQLAEKTPARCNYLFYHRCFQAPDKSLQYEIRTRRWGPFNAGGRDGGLLTDPLPVPSYRGIMECLAERAPEPEPEEPEEAPPRPVVRTVARGTPVAPSRRP